MTLCHEEDSINNIPMKKLFVSVLFSIVSLLMLDAQTAHSLFLRKDSLQVNEIVSEIGNQFNKVGHHGPAVENSHLALRIYFNDSGAIDVFSKTGGQMELLKYNWYPPKAIRNNLDVSNDHYIVGKTVGLGGIALWDGEKEVKLVATKGRTARAGSTKKGSYAEMIAYGVEYKGGMVDISIRIDVDKKHREAYITATELNGQKVQFFTGVNCHEGQTIFTGKGYIGVWGAHKGDKAPVPIEIGAGLWFKSNVFTPAEKVGDMVRIISKPTSVIKTTVVASSTKETELNTVDKFEKYILK